MWPVQEGNIITAFPLSPLICQKRESLIECLLRLKTLYLQSLTFTIELQGGYYTHFTGDPWRGYMLACATQAGNRKAVVGLCVCYTNACSHVNGREERSVNQIWLYLFIYLVRKEKWCHVGMIEHYGKDIPPFQTWLFDLT